MPKKAVLTADIIHSTKILKAEKEFLYASVKNVLRKADEDFDMRSEMYRGDSFQSLLNKPKYALRAALVIRTFIRSLNKSTSTPTASSNYDALPPNIFDIRMSMGIGAVDMEMEQVTTSDGKAFQVSGKLLDELKKSKYRFAINTDDNYNNDLYIESLLLDALINRTSPSQCEVIYYKLLDFTETDIATELHINQSAVNQRSVNGNWNIMHKMIAHFEAIYDR